MKGFYIYVKNELLEQKHYSAMTGNSIWLYLWLLDHMTSVNENGIGKVLNNRPITYELVFEDLGLTMRSYRRYIDTLRNAGYINTVRTPQGLCITVSKAKKVFGKKASDKNGTSPKKRSTNFGTSDSTVVAHPYTKNGTSIILQDNNNTVNNTNVLADKPPDNRKPEINLMFEFWKLNVGYTIQAKVQSNRRACSNLLKKHGEDKLKQLITGVVLTQDDQFAPRIADFCDLQSKLNQLIVWGRRRENNNEGEVTVIR